MFRNPAVDLIVVLVIVLLFFGPKRLPGLGRALGQGMREFKDGITGESKDDEDKPALSRGHAPMPEPEPSPDASRPPRPGPAQPGPSAPR